MVIDGLKVAMPGSKVVDLLMDQAKEHERKGNDYERVLGELKIHPEAISKGVEILGLESLSVEFEKAGDMVERALMVAKEKLFFHRKRAESLRAFIDLIDREDLYLLTQMEVDELRVAMASDELRYRQRYR